MESRPSVYQLHGNVRSAIANVPGSRKCLRSAKDHHDSSSPECIRRSFVNQMRQNAPLLVNLQDMKWQVNPAHSWIIAHKVASIVGRLVWHCVAIYLQEWRCKHIIKHVQVRNCSCILLASHFSNAMPLLMKCPMQWGNFSCLHPLKASPNPLQGGWLVDWQNSVSREVD